MPPVVGAVASMLVGTVTVALRYTLSRFEVVGDSTELSSVQLLSPAQFNRAQLSSADPSSEPSSIRGYCSSPVMCF